MKIVNVLKSFTIFAKSSIVDVKRDLKTLLLNNLLKLAEGLRGDLPPRGLCKGIMGSSYLLILLINTKNKKIKS